MHRHIVLMALTAAKNDCIKMESKPDNSLLFHWILTFLDVILPELFTAQVNGANWCSWHTTAVTESVTMHETLLA